MCRVYPVASLQERAHGCADYVLRKVDHRQPLLQIVFNILIPPLPHCSGPGATPMRDCGQRRDNRSAICRLSS
jgi:hypothetical protein